MHTHRERAQARMCTHVCERGRARSVWSGRARTHRPDDGAIPTLGAHGCAQTERSPRRERPLPRTQHTRQRRREWAKSGASVRCVHGSRAPRSACTRAALSTQPMRSAGAGRQATWGSPGEKCGTPRRAHQLLSCDGLSGVNGSVASRGVSAAYTIHVRVYIFATARAAAAHIAERVASQQPTPDASELADARVSSKRSYSATDPGPPRHCIPSRPISLLLAVLHHVGLRIRLSGGCSRRGRLAQCGLLGVHVHERATP